MIFLICNNIDCANKGAPYSSEDNAVYPCPVCNEPMVEMTIDEHVAYVQDYENANAPLEETTSGTRSV